MKLIKDIAFVLWAIVAAIFTTVILGEKPQCDAEYP